VIVPLAIAETALPLALAVLPSPAVANKVTSNIASTPKVVLTLFISQYLLSLIADSKRHFFRRSLN
jgi:hypothetical protein